VQVTVNGAGSPLLNDTTTVSASAWTGSATVQLAAGDVLALDAYGLLGALTLDGTAGASLSIVRVG
jgi:hypothetical protein